MGEADERLRDRVAEDQGLLTARSELNGHVAQRVAAAFTVPPGSTDGTTPPAPTCTSTSPARTTPSSRGRPSRPLDGLAQIPGYSVSNFHRHCLPAPTRWPN